MKLHNFSLDSRLSPAVPISPFVIFCFLFFNFPFNHNAKGGCGQPGSFEWQQGQQEWQLLLVCLELTWGSDFSAYLASDYYFMLCEFETHTRRAQQRREDGRVELEENFTRHAPQSMQQDIFFYCCVPSFCCVRVHGAMRVCVWCVPLCIIISLVQSFATFRFVRFRLVWFRFGFCFYAFIFRLPSLRHSSIIHIDFFCFSPLPTPFSSALLIFLVFRCPKMFFAYFFFCTLLFALWPLRLRFTCKQLTEFHWEMYKEKSGIC